MVPFTAVRNLSPANVSQHTQGPWAIQNGQIVEVTTGQPIPSTPANLALCAASATMFDTLEKIRGALNTSGGGFADKAVISRVNGYIDSALNYTNNLG